MTSLKGALKSWTAWFGAFLLLFPVWWPQVEPLLADHVSPEQYKWLVSIAGIITVILRVKTTQSIVEKGEA